jgi:hypothetical protein
VKRLVSLQFLNLLDSRWDSVDGDQFVAGPLPARDITQNKQKKCMPQVGFESTIPVFERAKTVLALDRAATLIGK